MARQRKTRDCFVLRSSLGPHLMFAIGLPIDVVKLNLALRTGFSCKMKAQCVSRDTLQNENTVIIIISSLIASFSFGC